MKCQDVCPYNKSFIDRVEDAEEFIGKETVSILKGLSPERLPYSIVTKLDKLNMKWFTINITRNLKVLINNKKLINKGILK